VRQHTAEEDTIVFRPNEPGLPTFRIKAKDSESQEFVRKAWLKDILEMQQAIGESVPDEEEEGGGEEQHQEGSTPAGEEKEEEE
jgi:1,2-phenylacetyl-CoA epoxidase catalytic subunit